MRYHGRLDEYPRTRRSAEEWVALVDMSDPESCWTWPGPANPQTGYGWTGTQTAHRWAYTKFVGPIPVGTHIDHVCHSRSTTCSGGRACTHRRCFNPAHLEAVPHGENILRGSERHETCQRGHAVQADSTRHWECLECKRASRRRAYAKNAERERARKRAAYAVTKAQGTSSVR